MFKGNDRVVCIDNSRLAGSLTIGKHYVVDEKSTIDYGGDRYLIIVENDNGLKYVNYKIQRFKKDVMFDEGLFVI